MQSRAKNSGYLSGLDGLRAFAILGVLFTHDLPWQIGRFSLVGWQPFGGMGVGLFFAISGFLITTRILEEEKKSGQFRLKSFYIRRLFRIQPALLVYLAVIALLTGIGLLPEAWHYVVGALLLFRNFQSNNVVPFHGVFTGHFWTLSVEEHFYLLLSLFLFYVTRRRIIGLALLITGIFLLQDLLLRHQHVFQPADRHTYMMLPFLLIPSLLAVVVKEPVPQLLATRFLRPWVAFLITATLLLLDCLRRTHLHLPGIHDFFAMEGISLSYCFPIFVIGIVFHPHSYTTRILELPLLRWLGRLSYSLYLWHVLFFFSAESSLPHWLSVRPWRYIASFACAILSYYFVEKPCMRLGHRLAPPVTPGHRDLEPVAS
jgi:peptidoglycan/LPS O-acetylase OafA/YrhL